MVSVGNVFKLFYDNVVDNRPTNFADAEENTSSSPFSHNDMKLRSKFNPQMSSNLEHIYYLILDDVLTYKAKNKQNVTFHQNN